MKLSSSTYTASEQRKARTKTTLIKFLLSRNIRSLRNTTHSNERYVPITGYRRQNYTKTKYMNSLGHHKLKRITDGGVVAEPSATGGYKGLRAKHPATGRSFPVFWKN